MNFVPKIRAAVYVRMSTEHQQYSTSNQLDVIKEYATKRNFEIVRIYSDEGKSGLSIQGRNALTQMIVDVESGHADFSEILVFDVSRWGRFQDPDESAYYDYICKRAGIMVHYCAEQFENDGSMVSGFMKFNKRYMSAEYSRELSSKVFQGACRLIQLGYRQGGMAGYGLRRMLVDMSGKRKGMLAIGEHKSIQTDRVILVPGPPEEVENVRWIYSLFVNENRSEVEIAAELNGRGVKTSLGKEWTRATVHEVLTNEKYIGHNVYHRTSFRLKHKFINNPEDKWIRANGVFQNIVDEQIFFTAHEIILARSRKLSNDEMLERLRSVLNRHGRISGLLIDESDEMPSSAAFRHRFGSLVTAYRLIGYTPAIDYTFIEINRELRRLHPEVVSNVIESLRQRNASVFVDEDNDLIHINGEITASIVIARCTCTDAGSLRWAIRLDETLRPDITIAARMDEHNKGIRDYYLLPAADMTWERLRLAEDNGTHLDGYRFPNLEYFFYLAKRRLLEEAA